MAVTTDPAIVALRKVPAKLPADAEVAPIWEKSRAGLELLIVQEPQLRLLALGGSDVPFDDLWSDLGQRIASYRETAAALRQLQVLLRHVTDPNSLRPKFEPALGAATLDALLLLLSPGGSLVQAISSADRLVIDVGRLDQGLGRREKALDNLALEIELLVVQELFVVGSTVADGKTPENPYLSMDGGFLYSGEIGTGALNVGTNIYTQSQPLTREAL